MERESAVREILQSIGPLFPEDAQRARAARRQAQQDAAVDVPAASDEDATLKLTTVSKPVLASQVDTPHSQKTQVASLAAVLERLVPPPPPPSVRDTVPDLVRPAPSLNTLRAALKPHKTPVVDASPTAEPSQAPEPAKTVPVVEASSAFTELPSDPGAVLAAGEEPVESNEGVAEPSAEEIQAALAEAVEAQRSPEEKTQPARVPDPEPVAAAPEFSEDEHDAFVSAIADAILPARPYPFVVRGDAADASAVAAESAVGGAAAPLLKPADAPPTAAATSRAKFKRAKPRQAAAAKKPEIVAAPPVKAPEPQARPQHAAATAEDDELIRQIRVHRNDMIDVDDQIARIDQEIAVAQQAMAQYVAAVQQKNAYRQRLLRLRTSTQRFVDTLQVRAEPVKRQPKQKKSA